MIMRKEIISLTELLKNGKKIAFIKGNRSVNSKNVESKKNSFEQFKMNLVPLMYVNGEKAAEDGCSLIDADTEQEVSSNQVGQYVAIIDGQHRYTAAMESELNKDNLFLFECYADANTKDLLTCANVDSHPWNTTDYAAGAVLFNPENQVAQFANELTQKKYPISTIGLILYFTAGKLTKKDLAAIMAGKDARDDYDIERAKCFLDAARVKFEDTFIAKRYLIATVIDLSTKKGYEAVCNALPKLSANTVKRVLEAKSDDKQAILKNALLNLLQ